MCNECQTKIVMLESELQAEKDRNLRLESCLKYVLGRIESNPVLKYSDQDLKNYIRGFLND